MYFFYIDESGSKDPKIEGQRAGGTVFQKDWLYVLTAVSLYERKWRWFDHEINLLKLELLDKVFKKSHVRLELADAEVKSTVLRIPHERNRSPFFSQLSNVDLTRLVDMYYRQIPLRYMHLFSVVIDKRKLHGYMDESKLHRKAYELLLERIENYMANFYAKHQAVIVVDDTSREMNRSLAMKHSYFLREKTGSGLPLRHIVELPFFTASNLSNGVQLADLCAYNVYRAFRYGQPEYPYFQRLLPYFYNSPRTPAEKLDGLKVFPDDSEVVGVMNKAVELAKAKGPLQRNGPSRK